MIRISQRLRLQNEYAFSLSLRTHYRSNIYPSQLLETLLDINESKRIPRHLRYALTTPPPESEVPDLQADTNVSQEQAGQILEEARQQLESGDLMQRDYDILVEELRSSLKKKAKVLPLPQMEQTISHTSLALLEEAQIPEDIKDEEFSTYLSALHEDTYLAQIDAAIDGSHFLKPDPQPQQPNQQPQQPQQPPPKPILSEALHKNPVSTYNWLRQHRPDLFESDKDKDKDKEKDKPDDKESKPHPSTPAAAAGNKRESSRAMKRTSVAEVLDDEGNVVGTYVEATIMPPSGKAKRKRDDDAYRPKGGGGSGGAGTGTVSKRRKRSMGKVPPAE